MALLEDIKDVVERHGDSLLTKVTNRKAPLLADGVFPSETIKSGVRMINVIGGVVVGGPGPDGGTYTKHAATAPSTLFAHRKLWYGQVGIPIGAASAADSQAAGIKLVDQYYDMQMGSLLMTAEMSLLSNTLGTVTTGDTIGAGGTTGESGKASVVVDDCTRFRPGMQVLLNDNGTLNANPFTVVSVTKAANRVAGTVVLSCAASLDGNAITATQDSFKLWDSASSQALTSLEDLTGSGLVYTQTAAIAGYTGVSITASGAYSEAEVLELLSEMAGEGTAPDLIIVSPKVAEAHFAKMGGSSFKRFNGDDGVGKADPYGKNALKEFEIGGVRAVVSPNCPAGKIFAVDSSLCKLGWYKKFEAVDGKNKADYSQTAYEILLMQHGHLEVVCDNRKAVGMITGVTFA